MSDDTVIEGEVEAGKRYEEADFNRSIVIQERERKRVSIFIDAINPHDKTLVFCANQAHALLVRNLINQLKRVPDPNYCCRVTANDGAIGDQHLRDFQDNERTIPTILTTSQKLSTGVDARNVRNIVLMRPVRSMVEFKQIIGRGTRIFEGKDYFTIYDFVKAHLHFNDPDWDGDPVEPERAADREKRKPAERTRFERGHVADDEDVEPPRKIVIKLADGKERQIRSMTATNYFSSDGKLLSAAEFIQSLYDTLKLPEVLKSEDDLRRLWSDPTTRAALLARLADAGFSHDDLMAIQKLIDAEHSDLFDVLEYVAFSKPVISRADRVACSRSEIYEHLEPTQREFIDFVLAQYVSLGVDELQQERLPRLIAIKYGSQIEGITALGGTERAKRAFVGFQRELYRR